MSPIDPVALRFFVYDEIVSRGLPPTLAGIGARFGETADVARRELAALKIGKTILPDPESGEIWMAGPFSAVETPYGVIAGDRRWWANCAWDMLGVAMIVNERAQCVCGCNDCGSKMTIDCDPASPPTQEGVVHFLLPARRWYDDIGYT